MKHRFFLAASLLVPVVGLPLVLVAADSGSVLQPETFAPLVQQFNRDDEELYRSEIPNATAWDYLKDRIPLLDCPDPEIQTTYYFRWWAYRKHIKKTPAGYIVDEFLPPVGWAGKYNSIDCAAGHHLYEGRWLRDPQVMDDYSRFWFRGGGEPRRYSFWAADALWARYCVTGDAALPLALLPDLVTNYVAWENSHRDTNGLYWQNDGNDGMEVSIGGSGYRATINSYQYGDALAISRIADLAGQSDLARSYREKAARMKRLVQDKLWDRAAQFFKVLPRGTNQSLAQVREEHGFTPWYFNLPDAAYTVAWQQIMDPQGFYAPFGPTTAEQRCPQFAVAYTGHECQWNGPSWPFATAVTLTALANLLNGPDQETVTARDYFTLLRNYAKSQRLQLPDGRIVPWIDENQNPTNGDWIARTLLIQRGRQIPERGKDYNHSTFADLIISGLVGLRPRSDQIVEINPLVPENWDYFCLDRVAYHGVTLTILWDRDGKHYRRGAGLRVFADGREIAASTWPTRLRAPLPARPLTTSLAPDHAAITAPSTEPAFGGWQKYAQNPVLGGQYGTCFDIGVLHEADKYRMWVSWRPKKSIALVESADGLHWSGPPQVVLGPRPESGWEDDINRPYVLKRGDTYHMWYTGQVKPGARDGHSWIGYATSPDGVNWKRMSDKPVLTFDQPWELGIAVMCPSVLWDETMGRFCMWYCGGEQNEPNAIGYATSPDGLVWTKCSANPVFHSDPNLPWEKHKVAGVQVTRQDDWYLLFYIGYRDEPGAQIGLARSRNGRSNWQRHPANPIVRSGQDDWDFDACYKPFALFDGAQWLLWYNGRHGGLEQIGVVQHPGADLGFEPPR